MDSLPPQPTHTPTLQKRAPCGMCIYNPLFKLTCSQGEFNHHLSYVLKYKRMFHFFMPYFGSTCENKYLHFLVFWIHRNFLDLLFLLLIVTLADFFFYILSFLNKTTCRYLFTLFSSVSSWVCNQEKREAKLLTYWKISIAQALLLFCIFMLF